MQYGDNPSNGYSYAYHDARCLAESADALAKASEMLYLLNAATEREEIAITRDNIGKEIEE